MKVTVIGAGNMGGALIKGWAKNTEIELTITAKTDDTLNRFAQEYPQLHTCKDNAEAVKGADVIVLAVKPWLIEQVCNQIKDSIDFDNQIIISIAANIFADKLRESLTKGSHTLSITALDNHIILDQWMLDFKTDRKAYMFPILPMLPESMN